MNFTIFYLSYKTNLVPKDYLQKMLKLSIVVTFGKKNMFEKVKIIYCLSCKDITLVPCVRILFMDIEKFTFFHCLIAERKILCVCACVCVCARVCVCVRKRERKYFVPLSNKNSE